MENSRAAAKLMPVLLLIVFVLPIVSGSSCMPTSETERPVSTMALATGSKVEAAEEAEIAEPEALLTEPEEKLPGPTQKPTSTSGPPTEIAPTKTTVLPATSSPGLISLPTLDTTQPPDIMQEVEYYVAGGGGPANCNGVYPATWDSYPPHVIWSTPKEDANWLDVIDVNTCGWLPQEQVTLTISSNDTVLDVRDLEADEWGSVWIDFLVEVEHTPGLYHFSFDGESGQLATEIQVNALPGPSLYHFFDDDKADTGQLLIYGFQPEEIVRLIVYEGRGSEPYLSPFKGWANVQADDSGQLFVMSDLVSTEGSRVIYVAVGELSGEATAMRRYSVIGLHQPIGKVYMPMAEETCSGALQSRLSIGDQTRVVVDRLSVREGPGTSYSTVYGTSLSGGRVVTITHGPVCSDGMVWWRGETGLITLTNGAQHNIVGWMAEESGGEWLLEPVP